LSMAKTESENVSRRDFARSLGVATLSILSLNSESASAFDPSCKCAHE
jgi:hypothetical protein